VENHLWAGESDISVAVSGASGFHVGEDLGDVINGFMLTHISPQHIGHGNDAFEAVRIAHYEQHPTL